MKTSKTKKVISMSLVAILMFELTACGTIFYPERKGQRGGHIDPVVAVADAIGLLFYFIPGVIAFAVDFSTGAIYQSHGRHSSLTPDELKSVTENGKVNTQVLNKILSEKFGQSVNVDASNVQVKKFDSTDALLAYFSKTEMQVAASYTKPTL